MKVIGPRAPGDPCAVSGPSEVCSERCGGR